MYLSPDTILKNNCYRIIRVIKPGGFGITYLANEIGYYKETGFGKEYDTYDKPKAVVIKELYVDDYCYRQPDNYITISNAARKKDFQKMVQKQLEEGKIIRSLKHTNIINTRDIFEENGTAYMVMDYIESIDLDQYIRDRGYLDRKRGLLFIRQVISAVKYIHERSILHLDISPSNLLMRVIRNTDDPQDYQTTDELLLIDFGASLTYGSDGERQSQTSQLVTGLKRNYAPNEQQDIDNLKHFDASFDTYAICSTFYYLLTRTAPPPGSLLISGREKLIPPSVLRTDNTISDYIDAIIEKGMSIYYRQRFKEVIELEAKLEKEHAYQEQLLRLENLPDNGLPGELLKAVEETEAAFLPTASLEKIKTALQRRIREQQDRAVYQRLVEHATERMASGNYKKALEDLESALHLNPDNAELIAKIALCRSKVEELSAQEKFSSLLKEAREAISNQHYAIAKATINMLLQLGPADQREVLLMLEQIRSVEQQAEEEIASKLREAVRQYESENFRQAKDILSTLPAAKLREEHQVILSRMAQQADQYDALQQFILPFEEVKKRSPEDVISNPDGPTAMLLTAFKSKAAQVEQLQLPHVRLEHLFTEAAQWIAAYQQARLAIEEETEVQVGSQFPQAATKKRPPLRLIIGTAALLIIAVPLIVWLLQPKAIATTTTGQSAAADSLPADVPQQSGKANFVEPVLGYTMVYVQAGANKKDTSQQDFYIGETEITQAQWKKVMGSNPSQHLGCDDCPVDRVSWNNIQVFIQKLNQLSGRHYRLPAVEEFGFAASGGVAGKGYYYPGDDSLNKVAWWKRNSQDATHAVKTKMPNELGIYDLSGNVSEITGTEHQGHYCIAGGSYIDDSTGAYNGLETHFHGYCHTVATRWDTYKMYGFRLVCDTDSIVTKPSTAGTQPNDPAAEAAQKAAANKKAARQLANEANLLFGMEKYTEAVEKYKQANRLSAGAGNGGYDKFMQRANDIFEALGREDDRVKTYRAYAQDIQRTKP